MPGALSLMESTHTDDGAWLETGTSVYRRDTTVRDQQTTAYTRWLLLNYLFQLSPWQWGSWNSIFVFLE